MHIRKSALTLMVYCLALPAVSLANDNDNSDNGDNGDNVTVESQGSAADGLDLHAVGELFKDSKDLEEFEKKLNDPDDGINNLDLDENGEVDFIRIVEEVEGGTHVVVLQAALGEDEFQDVATIEVEKDDDGSHNMQVHGDVIIYGPGYYVAPSVVHIHTWPIITWMYGPHWRPYRSTFCWGRYPKWWRPHRTVRVNVYHTRTVRYTKRSTFNVVKTSRVKTASKVTYKSKTSKRVTKRAAVKSRTGTKKKSAAKKAKKKGAKKKGGKKGGKRGGS